MHYFVDGSYFLKEEILNDYAFLGSWYQQHVQRRSGHGGQLRDRQAVGDRGRQPSEKP